MLSALFTLLVLAADIWAILNVVQSKATTGGKVLWILVILVFPLLGVVVWYFAGPKSGVGVERSLDSADTMKAVSRAKR